MTKTGSHPLLWMTSCQTPEILSKITLQGILKIRTNNNNNNNKPQKTLLPYNQQLGKLEKCNLLFGNIPLKSVVSTWNDKIELATQCLCVNTSNWAQDTIYPSKEQPVDYEASCHHTWSAAVITVGYLAEKIWDDMSLSIFGEITQSCQKSGML